MRARGISQFTRWTYDAGLQGLRCKDCRFRVPFDWSIKNALGRSGKARGALLAHWNRKHRGRPIPRSRVKTPGGGSRGG